jgi:hypothetical protein
VTASWHLNTAHSSRMGVAYLARGDDQHAIVGFVFQVKEPQQGKGQFGTVGSGTAQTARGAAMVIAVMPGPEPPCRFIRILDPTTPWRFCRDPR